MSKFSVTDSDYNMRTNYEKMYTTYAWRYHKSGSLENCSGELARVPWSISGFTDERDIMQGKQDLLDERAQW